MKSAMLITAYKDFDTLAILLKYYRKYYSCYLHIDKKVDIPESFKIQLKSMPDVHVIHSYRINWGSYRHISAFLKLLRIALDDGCQYFHLIPADTFPIKDINTTETFFAEHKEISFIESIAADQNDLSRQRWFYFQHLYNLKSDRGYTLEQRLLGIQKRLKIKRNPHMLRKGYLYCHLNRDFAEFVFQYLKEHPFYLPRLKTYSIPEEFFFQNIIYKSIYEKNSENRHLIYDIWKPNQGGPDSLSRELIDEAISSDRLFARKIDSPEKAEYLISIIEGKTNEL